MTTAQAQSRPIAQLKAAARERLLGKYGTCIAATLLFAAIELLAGTIVSAIIPPVSTLFLVLSVFSSFLVEILLGILVSGLAYLYLNVIYGQPVSVGDLFFGVRAQPEKAVQLQAVFSAAELLFVLPVQLMRFLYAGGDLTGAAALVLGVIAAAGAILYLIVRLTYAQVFFLLHDFPDRGARELLRTSRLLMRGRRLRLLGFWLSFLPLYLLGAVTLFLPLLWVDSYLRASAAAFYQNLIAEATS